jgi:4-amino-4-deoxy-L-arabinose transferase-like glycosyltransferase
MRSDVWTPALAGLFLFTRLFNLGLASPYWDEILYVYWGQTISRDWSQRFMGAALGGKQPLHTWLIAAAERLWSDPLVAGRLVSTLTGALTLVAIALLAERLFSTRAARLTVLLYILCPFTLLFDRQAMADSLLSAEVAWMMYLSVRLLSRRELLSAAGLALAFGAALLTKSIGLAVLAWLPAAWFAAAPGDLNRRNAARWLAAVLAAVALGWLAYDRLYVATGQAAIVQDYEMNRARYMMSLTQILSLPWAQWTANLAALVDWYTTLLSVPLTLLAVAAIGMTPRLGRPAWLPALWAVLPVAGQALIAARFYNRYVLFSLPPLLLLIGGLIDHAARQWWQARRPGVTRQTIAYGAALGLVLLPAIAIDARQLTDEDAASATVGGFSGLRPASEFLSARSRERPLVVVVEDLPAAPIEDGLAYMLRDVPGVTFLRMRTADQALFNPVSGQAISPATLLRQDVYFAAWQDADPDSWFPCSIADRLTPVQSFPNHPSVGGAVGLYRARYFGTDADGLATRIGSLAQANDLLAFPIEHQSEVGTLSLPGALRAVPLSAPGGAAALEQLVASPRRLFVLDWADDDPGRTRSVEQWLDARTFPASHEWFGKLALSIYLVPPAGADNHLPVSDPGVRTPDAQLGSAVMLRRYRTPGAQAHPGEIVPVALLWEALAPVAERYTAFVHLVAAGGRIVSQHDAEPGITTEWTPGSPVLDRHGLLIPLDLPPGRYQLRAGLYTPDNGRPLPVTQAGLPAGEWVDLGWIDVAP